ncbi:MAG: hypothetical protein RL662_541 [Bacteroidota bacterium]|jgi:hypothetical protein
MIQQRRKDYLQRLVEDFFTRFDELIRSNTDVSRKEKLCLLNDALLFFRDNFETSTSDTADILANKIGDMNLLEQYARLLLTQHQVVDIKQPEQLYIAFDLVKYIDAIDTTYSWERVVLREDILRLLNKNNV